MKFLLKLDWYKVVALPLLAWLGFSAHMIAEKVTEFRLPNSMDVRVTSWPEKVSVRDGIRFPSSVAVEVANWPEQINVNSGIEFPESMAVEVSSWPGAVEVASWPGMVRVNGGIDATVSGTVGVRNPSNSFGRSIPISLDTTVTGTVDTTVNGTVGVKNAKAGFAQGSFSVDTTAKVSGTVGVKNASLFDDIFGSAGANK
jgi:hypothetical protein